MTLTLILLLAVSCKPLEQIGFGHIAYSKSPSIVDGTYPQNTVATFSCNNGFSKTGPEVRTCQASGMWDKGHQFCMIGNDFNFSFSPACVDPGDPKLLGPLTQDF